MKANIICGMSPQALSEMSGKVDMIFADPPDNIGLEYDGFSDDLPESDYLESWRRCIRAFANSTPVAWFSYNAKWSFAVNAQFRQWHKYHRNKVKFDLRQFVQTYSFGQHNNHDFGGGFRMMARIARKSAPRYPEAIRIESERQKIGDKRADPRGRVPSDVFDFPRVVGDSKQRRKWHNTQLNEDLVERCILSCTKEGDHVLDPFGGTGTTLRVCRRLNRDCTIIEQSRGYCDKIQHEHNKWASSHCEHCAGGLIDSSDDYLCCEYGCGAAKLIPKRKDLIL